MKKGSATEKALKSKDLGVVAKAGEILGGRRGGGGRQRDLEVWLGEGMPMEHETGRGVAAGVCSGLD